MIANLLPGFRHARTPLIAGALWIISAWLIFGPDKLLPNADGSLGSQRMHALLALCSPSVIAAGVALAALLLGGLIPPLGQKPSAWIENAVGSVLFSWAIQLPGIGKITERVTPWTFWHPSEDDQIIWNISNEALRDLTHTWHALTTTPGAPIKLQRELTDYHASVIRSAVEFAVLDDDEFEKTAEHSIFDDQIHRAISIARNHIRGQHTEVPAEAEVNRAVVPMDMLLALLTKSFENEYDELVVRLQIERESLFNEVDRLTAEADLRRAMFVPLIVLSVTCAIVSTWWFAFALVLPIAFIVQGVRSNNAARLRVFTALRQGLIESPTMKYVKSLPEDEGVPRNLF